jgi:hypothetical protein
MLDFSGSCLLPAIISRPLLTTATEKAVIDVVTWCVACDGVSVHFSNPLIFNGRFGEVL